MARPAWPAPMTIVSREGISGLLAGWCGRHAGRGVVAPAGEAVGGGSAGVDLDGDGHSVGDDVVDGRALAGLLDDLAQLLGVVAAQLEADLDLLVTVADLVGEAQDAEQVDVTFDRGLDLGQVDLAGGGDVGEAGG